MNNFALTVIFDGELTNEYIDRMIDAIECFNGVLDITRHEVSPQIYWAKENAKREMRDKLWKVLSQDME